VTASYTLPLSEDVGEVTLGPTFTHTDANNSVSILSSPFLYRNPATNYLDLNVAWNSIFKSPVDLAFFMTNATNQKAWTYASGGYGGFGLDSASIAPPRMFGFRLRYSFGR
jgi:iron complex outermembrane receptor protein